MGPIPPELRPLGAQQRPAAQRPVERRQQKERQLEGQRRLGQRPMGEELLRTEERQQVEEGLHQMEERQQVVRRREVPVRHQRMEQLLVVVVVRQLEPKPYDEQRLG